MIDFIGFFDDGIGGFHPPYNLRSSCVGAGHARDQEQKNNKTQIKEGYFVFIGVHLRLFAFSVSLTLVAGMARSYNCHSSLTPEFRNKSFILP